MKGNKGKVAGVPCAGNIFLCRMLQSRENGSKLKLSEKVLRRMQRSVGINFNKTATKMDRLGYKPNIQEFESEYMCMSFGKSGT